MPLWHIHHPENAFSNDDKKALANDITGIYESFLPRFYVNVLFQSMFKENFFIGGEQAGDFVRVVVDHVARSIGPEDQWKFVKLCSNVLKPYVADRGFRWELSVDETPFGMWTIDGLKPPRPGTAAEKMWREKNQPLPYDGCE